MKSFNEYTILYVEDNSDISEEVIYFLEPSVKELYTASNGNDGLNIFNNKHPDIIITDIQMPIMNGLDMIKEIRNNNSEVPIVITTAFNEAKYLIDAINLKVDGYVMKPLNFKDLIYRLKKIIEPLELQKELIDKNNELEVINSNLDNIAKNKTKELEYLYSNDPLTELPNFIKLNKELDTGKYNHLLLLDISHFSVINKQYGKAYANKVLKSTANVLKMHSTLNISLFKAESDRFVFLLKEKDYSTIEEFCKQLISFFDTHLLKVGENEISISFSIGVSNIQESIYAMVNAEYALEIGKELGSRYYYFYDDNTKSIKNAKETIQWLNITKKIIEQDKVEPYFQPIVDLQTSKIVKYEVLARGMYNDEVLAPIKFLTPAEHLGLISTITRMMVNKSFNYFKNSNMEFSINLTQRDILDSHFINFLNKKLKYYNIKASNVTFEILETITLSGDHELILKHLKQLQSIGFKIAIDDFGIENSNLSRLLELDFNYIKLDGIFIKGLESNVKNRTIVSAIVGLAKALGIKTIAEYVENEAIYKILKEQGVDMAQGYYIGRPLPDKIED